MKKNSGMSLVGTMMAVAIVAFLMIYVVPGLVKNKSNYSKQSATAVDTYDAMDANSDQKSNGAHPYVAAYQIGTSKAKNIQKTLNSRYKK